MFMRGLTGVLVAAGVVSALGGCAKKAGEVEAPAQPTDQQTEAGGYLAPPQVTEVTGRPGGPLVIHGMAAPGARVRAMTPDKAAYGATTGDDGRFELEVPAANTPRLFGLSSEGEKRSTLAEGWLFVPPDAPERAVLLRPGASTRLLTPSGGLIAAVDYDLAGGAAVSGVTAPNAEVQVGVDAGEPAEGRADARGVFGLRLGRAVSPGPHVVRARAGGAVAEKTMTFAAHPATGTFAAVRETEGWRVNWTPPGAAVAPGVKPEQGTQTTLVLVGRGAS